MNFDDSGIFGISEEVGSFGVTGFLRYSQVFHDDSATVNDEFLGGMTIGYKW